MMLIRLPLHSAAAAAAAGASASSSLTSAPGQHRLITYVDNDGVDKLSANVAATASSVNKHLLTNPVASAYASLPAAAAAGALDAAAYQRIHGAAAGGCVMAIVSQPAVVMATPSELQQHYQQQALPLSACSSSSSSKDMTHSVPLAAASRGRVAAALRQAGQLTLAGHTGLPYATLYQEPLLTYAATDRYLQPYISAAGAGYATLAAAPGGRLTAIPAAAVAGSAAVSAGTVLAAMPREVAAATGDPYLGHAVTGPIAGYTTALYRGGAYQRFTPY